MLLIKVIEDTWMSGIWMQRAKQCWNRNQKSHIEVIGPLVNNDILLKVTVGGHAKSWQQNNITFLGGGNAKFINFPILISDCVLYWFSTCLWIFRDWDSQYNYINMMLQVVTQSGEQWIIMKLCFAGNNPSCKKKQGFLAATLGNEKHYPLLRLRSVFR